MAEQGDGDVSSFSSCLLSIRATGTITAPIESSKKIKYTCIAASQRYVALGANTGGVYCFHRDSYKYIRILASKEGSVSIIRFSPAGDYLAVCSGGGYLGLWELNLQEQGISKRVHVCSLLKEGVLRDLVWDSRGTRVFFGDDQGRVAVTHAPKQQKLFKKSDELLLQEKVPIVQLDLHQELLLVSTQTRCFIYRLLSKETVQIGTRPRDGMFGVCFYGRGTEKPPIVFSARPGGRLWQADVEGTVVSTLKLKDAVSMPPSPVLGVGLSPDYSSSSQYILSHSLNFARLALIHGSLMVGWVNKDLFLFEPGAYRLAAWTTDLGPILDLYCDGRQLFVLCEGGGVRVVSFVSMDSCIQWLVRLELLEQAIQVLAAHSEEVSLKMDSDEILYNHVHTLMEGLDETTPTLQALKTRLVELEDKYGHLTNTEPVDSKSSEENNIKESNIEESAQLENAQLDNGYETVDLTGYSNDHLDGTIETDHTATVDHVISDIDHMTSEEASTDTHVTNSDKDPQADFPLTFNSSSDQSEPTLDSTLIPSNQIDSTLIPDDLGDPLASSSQASLTQVVNNDDTVSTSRETSRETSRRSSTISAFPEEAGSVVYSRSQSQTIPSRVAPRTGLSLEGTPEYGTSVLSSSHVGGMSSSEPQSFENRLSFEPEGVDIETRVQKRPPPDFANRVAAALSSCSPDDDNVVVAIPVRSNSGSSKDGSKRGSKKKGSRKKKSASPQGKRLSTPDLPESFSSKTSSPSRSLSLVHIPEETLPFPEAGLPPSTPPSSHQNSALSSQSVSPYPSRPHTPPPVLTSSTIVQNGFVPKYIDGPVNSLAEGSSESNLFVGLQKPSVLSKMKNIAKQGVVESNRLQRPVKMVKELLSSLTNGPLASQDSQPTLYTNNNFVPSVTTPPPTSPPLEQGEMAISPTPPPTTVEEQTDGPTMDPETKEFVEATNSTWALLEDPLLYCAAASMADPLRDWLSQLDTYRSHVLGSEGEATNRGWSLEDVDSTLKGIASDLVSLCLEMGCYSDDLSPQGLAEFVCKYYPVLDMSRVWTMLSQQDWAVRVGVWRQLAACVDPGERSLQEVTSDLDHPQLYRLPSLLMRLYADSAHSFVEMCVSCYPTVTMWEVAVACEVAQSDHQNQSCDGHPYTHYLSQLVESRPGEQLSAVWSADSALLLKSLGAALESKPRPVASLLELLTEVCAQLRGESVTQAARDLCLKHRYWLGVVRLSVTMGDKRRALSMLVHMKDLSLLTSRQKWGDLLVTLEDWQLLLELLSSPDIHIETTPTHHTHSQATPTLPEATVQDKPVQPEADSPSTKQVTVVLDPSQTIPSLETGDLSKTLPCDGEHKAVADLTWAGVLRLMTGALPPEIVLKLLSGNHGKGFGGVLCEQLHGVLTQLVQIQTRQRALGHSLLERVDQYLWSPRPTAIAPQLLTVQNSEMTGRQEDHPIPLMMTSVTPLSECLEDAGVHWGVRTTPGSTCPLCRLSLLSPVSDLEPGVIALQCGHAYHKRCLPESACVVCFSENVRNNSKKLLN